MPLAERIKTKYIARIDELIASGTGMPMESHSQQKSHNTLTGQRTYHHYNLANNPEFIEWRTSCIAVLDHVVPESSLLRKTVDHLNTLGREPHKIEFMVGFLRSVRKELEVGSLDSLAIQIEAEVLSDYLEQASAVLAGARDEPSHIAAAVIAGASLERCLRTTCESLSPPESTMKESGAHQGMGALIDSLKKRGVFNELQAKELRAWAALRNAAAHGNFSDFTREQVEIMVTGVLRFVTEYTR